MSLAVQRILAAVTAIAVLTMSIDCACAGGMSLMKQAGDPVAEANTEAMPCCAYHGDVADHCQDQHRDAHKHQPNPCSGTCDHCGQTVMNDAVPMPSHGSSLLRHAFLPILAINHAGHHASDAHPDHPSVFGADLPPPVTSPTLLSLHCALTT